MLPEFDENTLRVQLASMPWPEALAFAAAGAERIAPNYETFYNETGWGDPASVRRGLDLIWQAAETATRMSERVVKQHLIDCEAAVPESEDFDSLFTSSAQDAVFAVCSLLDYLLDGSLDKLVLAARYPTDSVDLFVQEAEGMDPQDPQLEQRILCQPLMQQELARQQRDLRVLRAGGADAIGRARRSTITERTFELASGDR